MITVKPTGAVLGATVTGLDLKQPLSDADFSVLLRALGEYGVLSFPQQPISAAELKQFSSRFGGLQVLSASKHFEREIPEVTILSNIVKNGQPIGKADAGQFWHTDMTYNRVVGFVNVLVAHEVPMRDGKALGATEFTNTQAAYDDLPQEIKQRLADATATHYLNKNWEYLRASGKSTRDPLTEDQIRERPPVRHEVFLTHPITRRKVIYVNPSFVVKIDGMSDAESTAMLEFLLGHVLKPEYRYTYRWSIEDVLMWDHLGTWHNAVADYEPHEHRLMKRCQVLADRIFDPDFVREKLGSAVTA